MTLRFTRCAVGFVKGRNGQVFQRRGELRRQSLEAQGFLGAVRPVTREASLIATHPAYNAAAILKFEDQLMPHGPFWDWINRAARSPLSRPSLIRRRTIIVL